MDRTLLLLATMLACLSGGVRGDIKFPKNQNTNHRWPPLIYKHEGGRIPDGHLRPFGYQKKSEGRAKEFDKPLSPKEFHDTCVKANIPCLFQDLMNGSVPMENWDDKSIEGRMSKLNVSVERFLADKAKEKTKVTFRHFIRNYHHKEMFIRSTMPKELEEDVPILSMVSCGPVQEGMVEVVLWASSGFTPSRLHYDAESQLHCLLTGRKDFVLYDPKHADIFKLQETYKGSGTGFCPWNPEILSVYEHPKLSKTPWKWATLWAGDCLYVPQGYLHQVRAHGRSWSIAYHWIHSDFDNFEDCDDQPEDKRLSDTDIFWTYEEGDKRIREDLISGESLKKYLQLIGRQSGQVSYLKFYHFVIEANENYRDLDEDGDIEDPTEIISPREMFEKIAPRGQEFIKVKDLANVSQAVWEELAHLVTPPHSHEIVRDEL